MSTMYDTDMFEPLAMGKWTLNADVSDDRTMKKSRWGTGVSVARGTSAANVTAPSAMTPTVYQRARGGRSRSTTASVYTGVARPPAAAGLTHVKQVFYTVV